MIIHLDGKCGSVAHNDFGFVGPKPPNNLYAT